MPTENCITVAGGSFARYWVLLQCETLVKSRYDLVLVGSFFSAQSLSPARAKLIRRQVRQSPLPDRTGREGGFTSESSGGVQRLIAICPDMRLTNGFSQP